MAGPTVDALARVSLFDDLEDAELRTVAEAMRERTFAPGETITAEGAAGDAFFVIERGEADVTVGGEARPRLGPGDHIGEIALMTGGERTATVTAATELCCHVLAPADFRALVEGNPTIAWKVLESLAARLE